MGEVNSCPPMPPPPPPEATPTPAPTEATVEKPAPDTPPPPSETTITPAPPPPPPTQEKDDSKSDVLPATNAKPATVPVENQATDTVCLPCCSATDATKCEGPQCANCVPDTTTGTCGAAKPCCTQTPPCDDISCKPCPAQSSDKVHTTKKGATFNLPVSTKPPFVVEGYTNPKGAQGKFYMGLLEYTGRGQATCGDETSPSAEESSCMAKPMASKLEKCKLYCDADVKCIGFNIVYNSYNTPAAKWVRDAPNDGGLCVFMSEDPADPEDPAELESKECHDWTGEDVKCMQPYTDKNWFCCRAAYYYRKTKTVVKTATKAANGTVTITKQDANGTHTQQIHTKEQPKCMAKEGDGRQYACTFPFVYKGQSYSKCTSADNTVPWCFTNVKKGYWGICQSGCSFDTKATGGNS